MTEGGRERGREGERKGERGRGTDGEKRQGGRDGGQPLLLPCRSLLAAQCNNEYQPTPLKIELTNIFPAGLRRAIAAARLVTPFGMLLIDVNSDNSTQGTR